MVTFVVTANVMAAMSPNCMYSRVTWLLLEGNTWLIRSLFVFKIKYNSHWWPHMRPKLIICCMGQMWPKCLHCLCHSVLNLLQKSNIHLPHRDFNLWPQIQDIDCIHYSRSFVDAIENLGFIICSYKHLNSYFPLAMKLATNARTHKSGENNTWELIIHLWANGRNNGKENSAFLFDLKFGIGYDAMNLEIAKGKQFDRD